MVFLDLEIPLVPTGYPPVGTMGMSPRNFHDKKLALPPKVCVSNDALTGILYMQSFNYITCGFENNFNYKDKSFNECPDSHP